MTNAYYDHEPSVFEAVGNGNYLYRWDIQEETAEREEGVEPTVQWSCKETTVKGEPEYGKCVEAVIRETYTAGEEFAMINKYNSYKAGIITDESIVEEYEGYLREVVSIKERVKRDLASYV